MAVETNSGRSFSMRLRFLLVTPSAPHSDRGSGNRPVWGFAQKISSLGIRTFHPVSPTNQTTMCGLSIHSPTLIALWMEITGVVHNMSAD